MGDDNRAFLRKVAKAGFGDRDKDLFYVEWASKNSRNKHKIYYRKMLAASIHITPSDRRKGRGLMNAITDLKHKLNKIDELLGPVPVKVDLKK